MGHGTRLRARLGSRSIAAMALLLAVVAMAIAAGTDGTGIDLPGTQPSDGSGHPDYPPFRDGADPGTLDNPGNCANCHGDYRDAGQKIYEPFDSWAGSLMANAGRDPLFWAALDVANQDDVDRLGDLGVGDLCLRCHAPKGWLEGRSHCNTPWGTQFDGSCLEGTQDTPDNDFEGIQCHFCHRQYDASQPPPGEFLDPLAPYDENGQVFLTTDRREMRGPYSDAAPPPRHTAALSELHRAGAFCGQCHNVTNPALNRVDPDTGADLGYLMPIERTFDEWRQSEFGRPASPDFTSCQRCHMPPADVDGDGTTDDAWACSQKPALRGENTAAEGPIFTHFFRGGGSWMIEVLDGEFGAALGRSASYAAAREQSLRLLQQETADVALATPTTAPAGSEITATVTVTNRSGHKLPTGYPEGRRLFLHVQAGVDSDADGTLDPAEVSFESGAWDPATGVLAADPQLKIYEIEVGVWDYNGTGQCDLVDDATGRKMFHFVLNNCVVSDNRIPPKGFTPSDETAPVGVTYPANPDIPGALAHWDETPYSIAVPSGSSGNLLVRSRLMYQTTTNEYVEFLEAENRSTCDPFDVGCDPTQVDPRPNRGEKMRALWDSYGRSAPVVVGEALSSVPITGPAAVAGEASPQGGAPLLSTGWDDLLGEVQVSYEPACDATDHNLYWGDLAEVSSYAWSAVKCAVGVSGQTTFAPGSGSVFYVVVGNASGKEGSYGTDSSGAQRPEMVDAPDCEWPQDLAATCP